ncbi:hypothetical protein [Cyanobium sp. Morenito 9A2]|uniref:hypothetical protein n=1 Tax=Cyanobium sp. Morenito 9A2 TaxID=2823718 RepID=UPI0020CBD8DF|nr:hypothetical protein [Cyanobium sp. Morenito 9A2]
MKGSKSSSGKESGSWHGVAVDLWSRIATLESIPSIGFGVVLDQGNAGGHRERSARCRPQVHLRFT